MLGSDADIYGIGMQVKGDLGIPCLGTREGLQKIRLKASHCGECLNLNQNFPISMSSDLTGDVRKLSTSSQRLYS